MRISDWSSDVCSSDLKIEPIRTTVLPDFTAKVGELITMLNEANEVDRSVLIPNGAAIAEQVGQMRTNALAARATAESETAAKVDAVRMLTLVVSLAALVLGTLTAFFIDRKSTRLNSSH